MAPTERDRDNRLPTKWPIICQCDLYNSLPHEVRGKKAFLRHKQRHILNQQYRLIHGRAPTPPEAYNSEDDHDGEELRSGAEDVDEISTRVLGRRELYKHKPNINDFSNDEDELMNSDVSRDYSISSEGNMERGKPVSDDDEREDINIADDVSDLDDIKQRHLEEEKEILEDTRKQLLV